MKKSFILIPLMAALLCACGGNNSEPTSDSTGTSSSSSSTTEPVSSAVVYDFSSLTGNLGEISDIASVLPTCVTSGTNIVTAASSVKVFDGYGNGGDAKLSNKIGILKFGTASTNGSLTLTLSSEITKVSISCHDFYTKSDQYPTNSNAIVVGGEEKTCPYNDSGDGETLEWTIEKTKSVTIESKNTAPSKGGRFIVYSITLQ